MIKYVRHQKPPPVPFLHVSSFIVDDKAKLANCHSFRFPTLAFADLPDRLAAAAAGPWMPRAIRDLSKSPRWTFSVVAPVTVVQVVDFGSSAAGAAATAAAEAYQISDESEFGLILDAAAAVLVAALPINHWDRFPFAAAVLAAIDEKLAAATSGHYLGLEIAVVVATGMAGTLPG
jgi:hypothetical protein